MATKSKIGLVNLVAPTYHVSALIHHVVTMYTAQDILKKTDISKDDRLEHIATYSPMFFTNWNMIFQTLYFSIALIYDVAKLIAGKNNGMVKNIELLKGYFFTSVIFPCALFVSTLFWSIYSIDRELVYSKILDNYFPIWVNHSVHTNIVIFLFIEVLIASQKLPSFKAALMGLTILGAVYNILFFKVYFQSGRWVYALFQILSWPERIFLPIFNYVSTVVFLKLGIFLENYKRQARMELFRYKSS